MNKPEGCKVCPLYASQEGIVFGQGPKDAKIMLVGEAPGEEEGQQLRPFVGGSGRVLNAMLQHAGIDRNELFVTNVVKCRPTARGAAGKMVNRIPTETEIKCCARFLAGELDSIRPNVIVAMGNTPLHTLTSTTKGITIMRSVPIEGPKRKDYDPNTPSSPQRFKVVPTLHPANVMRQQHMWPAVVFDLVRARNEGAFSSIVRRPWEHVIHASLADHAEPLLRRIRDGGEYGGLRLKPYFHDLETTDLDPRKSAIRCIGIGTGTGPILCFDWTNGVQRLIADIHADPSLMVVGQNSEGFDIPYQEAKGFDFAWERGKWSFDTLLGWHQLNSALPKDLASIGASVTDEIYWKDNTMYKAGEDALQVGCCKDVYATKRGFEDEMLEMQQLDEHQLDLYFKHIMPLQPVLRNMSRRGLRKDMRAAAGWHIVLNRKADEFELRLKRGLGDASFNVNSSPQLIDLLYNRMKLPIQWKNDPVRGARPTVDADALDNLALLTKNPIFLLVRSIRTLRKWDSTFVQCEQDEHHFVHPHFGSAKVATGRLNSWDPNFQNWPNEVREIIVPDDEDSVILSRDWSGIEWLIAMTLSGDRAGLDALAAGRDPHSDAYSKAFHKAYDQVTNAERFEAKTINYGLLYGRSNDSLALGRPGHPESAIPLDQVNEYTKGFYAEFAGYYTFREHIKQFVLKHHYYATAWGRRRWWFTRQQLPEAFNFPMQGNAAHMMYEALVEMEQQLPKGASLRASVHDECLVMSKKSVAREAEECMRDVMQKVFPRIQEASRFPDIVRHYYPNGWYCPSDGHVGTNWRECKPDKTPAAKEKELKLRKYLGMKDK